MARFVVLHHTGIASPHFDLMIESSPTGLLYTFACPADPFTAPAQVAPRLPNHRRAYLDYEGDISNNRGQVRRVRAGQAPFHREGRTFTLATELTTLTLTHAPDGLWHITSAPALRPNPTTDA